MLWVSVGMLIPLSIVGLPIVFWLIRRSSNHGEPFRSGNTIKFRVSGPAKFLIAFVLLLLIAFTVFIGTALLNSGGNLVAILIPIAVTIAIVLALPTAIVVDDTGIRQRRLFRDRHTSWADISTVTRHSNRGRTIVRSNDGKIAAVFSWFLQGRHRFEQEIRAHAKEVVFERD